MQKENRKHGFLSMAALASLGADGAEISERAYSLILGGMLTWGLALSAILLKLAGPAMLRVIYSNPSSYSGMAIGGLIVYFALVFIGNGMLRAGNLVSSLIGFHLIAVPVALVASIGAAPYLSDTTVVFQAVCVTAVVTLALMIAGTLAPNFFCRLGGGLAMALLAVCIYSLVAGMIFHTWMPGIDYVIIGIMALYIGFDWARAHSVFRTAPNAIAAAAALYLDIINIFLRVLRIIARSRSRD